LAPVAGGEEEAPVANSLSPRSDCGTGWAAVAADSLPPIPPSVRAWQPLWLWAVAALLLLAAGVLGTKACALYRTDRLIRAAQYQDGPLGLEGFGGRERALADLTEYLRLPKNRAWKERRRLAVTGLWRCGRGALPELMVLLNDDDPVVRERAAAGVAKVLVAEPRAAGGSTDDAELGKAAAALDNVARTDREPSVRQAALAARQELAAADGPRGSAAARRAPEEP
jgi:hypothetical protein